MGTTKAIVIFIVINIFTSHLIEHAQYPIISLYIRPQSRPKQLVITQVQKKIQDAAGCETLFFLVASNSISEAGRLSPRQTSGNACSV